MPMNNVRNANNFSRSCQPSLLYSTKVSHREDNLNPSLSPTTRHTIVLIGPSFDSLVKAVDGFVEAVKGTHRCGFSVFPPQGLDRQEMHKVHLGEHLFATSAQRQYNLLHTSGHLTAQDGSHVHNPILPADLEIIVAVLPDEPEFWDNRQHASAQKIATQFFEGRKILGKNLTDVLRDQVYFNLDQPQHEATKKKVVDPNDISAIMFISEDEFGDDQDKREECIIFREFCARSKTHAEETMTPEIPVSIHQSHTKFCNDDDDASNDGDDDDGSSMSTDRSCWCENVNALNIRDTLQDLHAREESDSQRKSAGLRDTPFGDPMKRRLFTAFMTHGLLEPNTTPKTTTATNQVWKPSAMNALMATPSLSFSMKRPSATSCALTVCLRSLMWALSAPSSTWCVLTGM